jgi:predicted RNA-binding Zn-ribbon protein involved in translation (DUF1610 family)
LLEIILVVIVVAIAFFANSMLPSKTQIQNNQAQKYKSKKNLIYIGGVAALAGGVLILLLYIMDTEYQKIINVLYVALLVVIGISLISANNKRSKFMSQCEAAGYPMAAPMGAMVTPMVAAQVPAQQMGVQTAQTTTPSVVTAQQVPVQQVPAQQVAVRAQPTQQVQPRQMVQQPQQAVVQKPKILRIKCPRCKGDMQIDTRMLGQKMKCPHCGIEGKIG